MNYDYYLKDIEVAIKEIKNAKLYPDTPLLCDVYALPPYAHQTYYGMIYKKDQQYYIAYAKSGCYAADLSEIVPSVSFQRVKSIHAYGEHVLVGIKPVLNSIIDFLICLDQNTEKPVYWEQNSQCFLDGVFQCIRFFSEGKIKKQLGYWDAETFQLPGKLGSQLNQFYLELEKRLQ